MENVDFIDKAFAALDPSTPEPSPQEAKPPQEPQLQEKARAVEVVERLPGLHLTAAQLAQGLMLAWESYDSPKKPRSGRLFLAYCQMAFERHRGREVSRDEGMEVMWESLLDGSWRPSLQELLEVGITQEALNYMPKGRAQIQLPGHEALSVSTRSIGPCLEGLASLSQESRDETVEMLAMIERGLGGMLVFVEGEPAPEPPKEPAKWVSWVSRERDGNG